MTKADMADVRYKIADATSSGSPMRPSGVAASERSKFRQVVGHRRADDPWRHRVHSHAEGRHLGGHHFGELNDRRFGGDVREQPRLCSVNGAGCHVQDAAGSLAHHLSSRRLTPEEDPLEVDGQHAVEVSLLELQHRAAETVAGDVGHHVDPPVTFDYFGDQTLHLVGVGDIESDG